MFAEENLVTKKPRVDLTVMASDRPQALLDDKALNRFSRQNAALGAETTAKLIKMKVLVIGQRGVGVETCKNLALQGVGGLTLYDPMAVAIADCGVNFFLTADDVGKSSRATVVAPRLEELNPLCHVEVVHELTDAVMFSHSAVVVTLPTPIEELIRMNDLCRSQGISFFYAQIAGLVTSVFVDHGASHVVHDPDGERPMQKLITALTRLNDEEVLIRYDTPEGQRATSIHRGSYEVSDLEVIPEMNDKVLEVYRNLSDPVKTIRAKVHVSSDSLAGELCGVNGVLTEKKVPTAYPMLSLREKLAAPGSCFDDPPSLVSTDLVNFGVEVQLHVAMYATLVYARRKAESVAAAAGLTAASSELIMPSVGDENAVDTIVEIAKELLSTKVITQDIDLDEDFIKKYARHAAVELQPLSAFIGGVLAQEIVKCTGKFTPIPGFMHFHSLETLPDGDKVPSAEDTVPRGSQYDELASVFGWTFVESLQSLRYFMVGCGALGCEFLKNFALNGVCCGPDGRLFVTDADRIELSNLSRQFLFREHNVGQPKSRAAADMAVKMNPSLVVEPMETFVGPKTENIFNDAFWMGLDGVCNALDNIEARLYVDRQCVRYEKSLLESGTMGTSGNVDVVCPFKTRTYTEGGNAAEGGGIPMCTLRNFPHLTDHCIEWARDQFQALFANLGPALTSYLKDPTTFENKVRDKAASEPGAAFFDIRSLISFAKLASSPSIGGAAQVAYDLFHLLFRDKICDLQSAFPRDFRVIDEKTKADKGPFWSEKKRYPTAACFNPNDESHRSFLRSTACMLMVTVGLAQPKKEDDMTWMKDFRDDNWVPAIVNDLTVPVYVQAPVNSDGIDNAPPVDKAALDEMIDGFFTTLRTVSSPLKTSPRHFEIADFEKDDDLNFHIEFITAAANLRCDNYSIRRTDFQSCKVIAGRIIPAIATTTAAVCGLVILELFKLKLGKGTDSYMNRAIGLGGFTYTSFTADEPRKLATYEEVEVVDPATMPPDAFDERGLVKADYLTKVTKRAYPDPHTVWDKIVVDANFTLAEFAAWLASEHKLRLNSWDFIYGHKTIRDAETNAPSLVGVSAPVYPIKPVLDYSLIPSLDLSLPQANMAIMRNPQAKPAQQYLSLWREFKAAGAIPPQPPADPDMITNETTIKEIFHRMAILGQKALDNDLVETCALSDLENKKFVVIPGSDTPTCTDIESGDIIEFMAALKFNL